MKKTSEKGRSHRFQENINFTKNTNFYRCF